jgi:hypothetical protein
VRGFVNVRTQGSSKLILEDLVVKSAGKEGDVLKVEVKK